MYKEWLVDNVLGEVVPYQTGDRMFPTKWATPHLLPSGRQDRECLLPKGPAAVAYHYLTSGRGSVLVVIDESYSPAEN